MPPERGPVASGAVAGRGRAVSVAGDPEALARLDDRDLAMLCRKFAWLSSFAGDDPSSAFHGRLAACRAEMARRGVTEMAGDPQGVA